MLDSGGKVLPAGPQGDGCSPARQGQLLAAASIAVQDPTHALACCIRCGGQHGWAEGYRLGAARGADTQPQHISGPGGVLRHACGCSLQALSVCCQLDVLLQQADVLVPQVLRLLVQEGQLILKGAKAGYGDKIQAA